MKIRLDPAEPGHISLIDPSPDVASSFASRIVISTPAVRITQFHFADGQELSEHASKARAFVQIIAGSCRFTVNGTPHELKAGDLLAIPPRAPHALLAHEAVAMLLTQVTDPS